MVLIAGVVVHGAIGFIGVVFAVVWLLIVYLRAEVKRRQERGLLPGQQTRSRVVHRYLTGATRAT